MGHTCRPHNQGAVWFAFAAEDQTGGKSAGMGQIFLARFDFADLALWTDLTGLNRMVSGFCASCRHQSLWSVAVLSRRSAGPLYRVKDRTETKGGGAISSQKHFALWKPDISGAQAQNQASFSKPLDCAWWRYWTGDTCQSRGETKRRFVTLLGQSLAAQDLLA